MRIDWLFKISILLAGFRCGFATEWNESPDPNALYGVCILGSKQYILAGAGEQLTDVLAITVLSLAPFSGSGGSFKVPCPDGSPYAYCINNNNDGLGNEIKLGIVKRNEETNPDSLYKGCPGNATPQKKIKLLQSANRDPRRINGIVTLTCGGSSSRTFHPAESIPCPPGPHPYAYCLGTENDGYNNTVTVGVIAANGAGDPYGLYGESGACNQADYGQETVFFPKTSLIKKVGRSIKKVRSIDLINVAPPGAFGPDFPSKLKSGSCSIPWIIGFIGGRYTYCIWGTDDKGNGVIAGVNQ